MQVFDSLSHSQGRDPTEALPTNFRVRAVDDQVRPIDLVLFGATGDLARRKLLAALYYMVADAALDDRSRVFGVGRKDMTRDEYLAMAREAVVETVSDFQEAVWDQLAPLLRYHSVVSDPDYEALAAALKERPALRIYYLALPYDQYGPICRVLAARGLTGGGARVVLEKPIGRDFQSAFAINQAVAECFDEREIYRIDHYLGKETVQNLVALRFANVLFEPLWRAPVIDYVQISVEETIGSEGRDFYDSAGAMRDMVQNHLMQLLCLVAMEIPNSLDPDAVRDEKVKVLRALAPLSGESARQHAVRGQYIPDRFHRMQGYVEELGRDSNVETFVALRLEINNWRWRGVPFYLRTGKRLARRSSQVIVQFKEVPHSMFPGPQHAPNRLTIRLQPEEGIELGLMAKKPGVALDLQPVDLELNFAKAGTERRPQAYERLLRDVLRGDPTLFMRRDEVEEAWRWVNPILETWAEHPSDVRAYEAGTHGPEVASRLLAPGHVWDAAP